MSEARLESPRFVQAMVVACLAYPWINPFAGGPSSSVQPWLVSALCASLLLALRGWRAPAFPAAVWLAFAAVATALRALPALEAVTVAAALLVIVAAAGTVATAPRESYVDAIATAWLIAACVSALFALLQYFGASDVLTPWVSGAAVGEAYGNLRQRNQLASLMAIGLASLGWFVGRGMPVRTALAPLLVLAAGSAASASRTGALQWIVLLALAALWRAPRRKQIVAVAAIGLAAYAILSALLPLLLSQFRGVAGPSVYARFVGETGCFSRRVLWSNVVHLVAQRPWMGWGWGELDWAHYMTLYPGERFCDILDNAHSLPLHLAVELGLPVALVACGGLAWALVRIAPWRETDAARQLALAVLSVIAIHSLLEYPLWYGPFEIALGLSLGLLWPAPDVDAVSSRVANTSAIVAAFAICATGYAAWDYRRISQIYKAPEARDERYRDDPLPELHKSWLFRAQVEFAELTITPLTLANAQWTYDTATAMLHYSPEPRVIEKIIESATLLGKQDVALAQLARFRAAFPKEHAEWASEQKSGARN
ncbi:MAG TPA: Wzy polymerase domain-containing protein [Ramlibacter sp.]|nr:Wzy polymerase domain-containing protein [Ramlibacter sp.]